MRTVIGVMGGAFVDDDVLDNAREIGRLIAEQKFVLLTGGRNAGVMAEASRGASEAGGLVIGILPGDTAANAAPHLDVAIVTDMGDGRNVINVLSSRVVVALPGGPGTVSEIALALKAGRPVVLLGFPLGLPFGAQYERGQLVDAHTPREAITAVLSFLSAEEGA